MNLKNNHGINLSNYLFSGIVLYRWDQLIDNRRPHIELIVKANYIELHNGNKPLSNLAKTELKRLTIRNFNLKYSYKTHFPQVQLFKEFWQEHKHTPITGRNIIIQSLCPQLYGMYVVKLAVALALIGGVSRQDTSGTRVRGESHLLLVGDPGTANTLIN
jgi:DNA helicase MCM9